MRSPVDGVALVRGCKQAGFDHSSQMLGIVRGEEEEVPAEMSL